MKVLVTGASGYIGHYVIEELLGQGHTVVATSTSKEKVEPEPWFNQVRFVAYSLEQTGPENLFSYFGEPDLLIHLAWQGLPHYKELYHISRNLFQQFAFIQNLVEHGLKDLLVTGTCFEYGMQSGALREDMTPLPENPYAIAKDSLRKFIEVLQTKRGFHFKWVRLFYMYGKGQSPGSLIPLLEKAVSKGEQVFNMSGGEQLRDYLKVEEVARIIVKIALQQTTGGIINCCSGKPVSVRSLVEKYLHENGLSIGLNLGYYPYPDYEPMAFWGDAEKLNKVLHS
ncbi:MAG: NAD-dependent epimerase/dehydratase family protein [Williamsia sp.]|nr:NAD-dependent epimerase/dehydratase family protein [Williamsia sp.]